MPNSKAVGVAFADPEFESVSVTGAVSAASVAATGAVSGTQLKLNAPVAKTASFTLGATENFVVCNGSAANVAITFPTASANTGRVVWVKNLSATYTVISASSNVKPANSDSAGTAILANTAGAWAMLVCDGTNWVVMAS